MKNVIQPFYKIIKINKIKMVIEEDFEEDVIIEGSDLHLALINMGCTDFESATVNRVIFDEKSEECHYICDTNYSSLIKNMKKLILPSKKMYFHGIKQLKIILQLDCLLDDHSQMIKNMLNESVECQKSPVMFSYILIGSFVLLKPLRIVGIISLSSMASYLAYQKVSELISCSKLRNLVLLQNKIHHLIKKALRILKERFRMKLTAEKYQKKFSDMQIEKLRYLQPLGEILTKVLEQVSNIYYQMSVLLVNSSQLNDTSHLLTNFNKSSFKIQGEITYENLKQLYYTYILTQSELMHILAILYHKQPSVDYTKKVITILCKSLTSKMSKLHSIVEKCTNKSTEYILPKFKKNVNTKLQDLHLHIDLLSRKIQSVYNNINSVIDDIDNATDLSKNDVTLDLIIQKMDQIYKEINTAKNFAEFNNLLIRKVKNSQVPKDDGNKMELEKTIKQEQNLKIIFDEDPQIMDEVFEEYIKEEYLRPLYEDSDIDSQEKIKLDKLLAKNFMSELKEVLIDKCKTMTEREAKALMRYKKAQNLQCDDQNDEVNEEMSTKTLEIPVPPPCPPPFNLNENETMKEKVRAPLPLPRSRNSITNANNSLSLSQDVIEIEEKERFSINMAIFKTPGFQMAEETFMGSGENSEDEDNAGDTMQFHEIS